MTASEIATFEEIWAKIWEWIYKILDWLRGDHDLDGDGENEITGVDGVDDIKPVY